MKTKGDTPKILAAWHGCAGDCVNEAQRVDPFDFDGLELSNGH